MNNIHCKNTRTLLEGDHRDLRFLFRKIKTLEELNIKISACLSPDIRKYCQAVNFINGTLTLLAANGSAATQLRFLAPDLIRQFQKDESLSPIKRIECKVRPPHLTAPQLPAQQTSMPLLSPQTAVIVKEIASSIKDETLRGIIERIAGRVKK